MDRHLTGSAKDGSFGDGNARSAKIPKNLAGAGDLDSVLRRAIAFQCSTDGDVVRFYLRFHATGFAYHDQAAALDFAFHTPLDLDDLARVELAGNDRFGADERTRRDRRSLVWR